MSRYTCRRYHPVDCIESNRATAFVDAIGNGFPHVFNLKLQGEAVAERAGTHRRGHKQMETHVNFERRRQHFPGANFF